MRVWALLFASTLLAQNPHLEQALANEAKQLKERERYFYREHAEHRHPNGQLNYTQDYEWIYLEGEPFRKLVARNGKPLKGKLAAQEEERLRMTAAERRAASRKPNPRVISVGNLSGKVILTEMDHTAAGEEEIDSRKTWVIRAEPKPGHEAVAYRMTFWIDQQDHALAQLKYEVIGYGVESLPGTWLTTRYVRFAENLWFKKTLNGEFYTGPPRPRSHWIQQHTFRDFRKFDAESTVTFQEK
jgi:hypothetical protein